MLAVLGVKALGLAGPTLAGGTSLTGRNPAKGQRSDLSRQRSDRDAPVRAPHEGAPLGWR